jgi:N-acetylneuraminic acid mutarotase
MRYFNIIVTGALLLSFFNCNKNEELQPRTYPYVITNSPNVNNEVVEFSANIINLGDQDILKYGFVWGKNPGPTVQNSNKLVEGMPGKGNYSIEINSGLAIGETYYVRAYIRTARYDVYGNEKAFVSRGSLPPEIISFSPQKGYAGKKVKIEGKNFAYDKNNIIVKFGIETAIIDSFSHNAIYVKSPLIKESGKVRILVQVAGMETVSADDYEVFYSWSEKESFPGERKFETAYFSINNYGYMIGEQEDDVPVLWRYNPDENSWLKMNTLPPDFYCRTGTFVINNTAYIFSYQNRAFYRYNSENDSWTIETKYPGNGRLFTTFVINDEAYVGLGTDFSQVYKEFYKYNPDSKQWVEVARFPGSGRYYASGFSLNGKGYVALGQGFWAYYNDVWEYNPETNSWLRKNYFPGENRSMSLSFVLKDKLYLGLGDNGKFKGLSDIWEYQQDTDSWREKEPYIGQGKWHNISFTLNDKAFVGSGYKSYGGSNCKDLWEFNPNLE